MAGEQVVKVFANQEAVTHYSQALSILRSLSKSSERDEQELRILMRLFAPLMLAKGFADPEFEHVCNRARTLCEKIGITPQLFPILFRLGSYYCMRGRLAIALGLKGQMFALADQLDDPAIKACTY